MSEQEKNDMINRAYEKIKGFDWKLIADKYKTILTTLAKS
jgi:hypothetical protein